MSKSSNRLKRQREKKKLMERIERNKRTIFGNKDLTPYNVGRYAIYEDCIERNEAYK